MMSDDFAFSYFNIFFRLNDFEFHSLELFWNKTNKNEMRSSSNVRRFFCESIIIISDMAISKIIWTNFIEIHYLTRQLLHGFNSMNDRFSIDWCDESNKQILKSHRFSEQRALIHHHQLVHGIAWSQICKPQILVIIDAINPTQLAWSLIIALSNSIPDSNVDVTNKTSSPWVNRIDILNTVCVSMPVRPFCH